MGKLIKESSSEPEVQCSIESIKLDDLTSWWTLFRQIDSAQYLGIDDRRNQENNISGSNMKNGNEWKAGAAMKQLSLSPIYLQHFQVT